MSQAKLVANKLNAGQEITSMSMFRYGITRLSAVIYDLRAEGMEIETTLVPNKNGNGAYAVYTLKEEE